MLPGMQSPDPEATSQRVPVSISKDSTLASLRRCIVRAGSKFATLLAPKVLTRILTFGISERYYNTRKFSPTLSLELLEVQPHPQHNEDANAKWDEVVMNFHDEWKIVSVGCGIGIPLSVGLLQIDSILQSTMGRTTAIMTFILSGAGFILAASFLIMIRVNTRREERRCPSLWIEASRDFDHVVSIEFWTILAMPLCLFIWSAIFCAVTVLSLAWSGTNDNIIPGGGTSTLTGIWLLTFTLLMIGPVYRAITFVLQLG
ncbi:hypothetical protein BDN70DRAFT_959932 [Pholiota conissans]|uniref:Uncharacterized protein n=1 Tax=Pholiota conissans TaxID=109636 RepID=A0A9P5YSG6_9AGAR|nr:hypothetical protein BDN70DRAFT_959932 [Pholiota conissans]